VLLIRLVYTFTSNTKGLEFKSGPTKPGTITVHIVSTLQTSTSIKNKYSPSS